MIRDVVPYGMNVVDTFANMDFLSLPRQVEVSTFQRSTSMLKTLLCLLPQLNCIHIRTPKTSHDPKWNIVIHLIALCQESALQVFDPGS